MSGPVGLLPYGSTDNSVIFRRNLLAKPTAAGSAVGDVGTCTVTDEGTGASYDPVLGLYNVGTNDTILSAIGGSSAAMAKLAGGGQIYFEVPTNWIACSNTISEGSSGGIAHAAESCITFLANPNVNSFYWINFFSDVDNAITQVTGWGTSSSTWYNYFSDAIGSAEYTPIIINCNGDKVQTYVNGVYVDQVVKQNTVLLPFDSIVLSRYGDGTQHLNVGHIRNLQISTRPVTFAVSANLYRIAAFGDSYSDATLLYQPSHFNLDRTKVMRAILNASGWDWGSYIDRVFNGRTVIGSNGTWNTADAAANYLAPNLAGVLASNPSVIIFQSGVNDLTQTNSMSQANFTTSLQGFVQQAFGLNGNPATNTRKIILCTTPWAPKYPDAAQALLRQPDITKIWNAVMGIPGWFNATYPSRAGDVSVGDQFTALGGFNAPDNYHSPSGLNSPIGRYLTGTVWGNSMLNLVNT